MHRNKLPVIHRYKPEDSFFEDGNLEREMDCPTSLLFLESNQLELNLAPAEVSFDTPLRCNYARCEAKFAKGSDFAAHYESSHRNTCIKCSLVLPNNHLLECHIMENHDTYFQTLALKRPPKFRCLVEECKVLSTNDSSRLDHLRSAHAYPACFRFRKRPHKSEKSKKPIVNSKSIDSSMSVHGVIPHTCDDKDGEMRSSAMCVGLVPASAIMSGVDSDINRKKFKKKKKPCKFHSTAAGCSTGASCKFSHNLPSGVAKGDDGRGDVEVGSAADKADGMVIDPPASDGIRLLDVMSDGLHSSAKVEELRDPLVPILQPPSIRSSATSTADSVMEDLEASMKKLKIPKSISFGRRKRG